MNVSPSMAPLRGITWPMVAYALVRELPSSLTVAGGVIVAVVLISKHPESAAEPLMAAIVPGVVAALQRSRPAESIDVSRVTTGGSSP